jgi:hypothetical protein
MKKPEIIGHTFLDKTPIWEITRKDGTTFTYVGNNPPDANWYATHKDPK